LKGLLTIENDKNSNFGIRFAGLSEGCVVLKWKVSWAMVSIQSLGWKKISVAGSITLLSFLLFLSSCASDPQLTALPPAKIGNQTGTDDQNEPVDQDFNHPFNEGGCETGDAGVQTYELVVDAAEAFNVVFILDDSSSMGPLIEKVVEQTQGFISSLLAATLDGDSVRIGLIFNSTKAGFSGFPNTGGNTRNPFVHAGLVDNERVFHFEQETASKWADRAFYQVFGQTGYLQSLPSVIPLDRPASAANGPSITVDQCQPTGNYFRPRVYPFNQDVGWPWIFNNHWNHIPCVETSQRRDISEYFISGAPLNVVTLSDDDLNLNFDRFQFDPNDPQKRAYPEIADLMFKDIAGELASTYHYHSIINLANSGGQYQEIGIAHWALSLASSGAVFDIQQEDYQPIFDQLVDQIIYSSQARNLQCSPQVATVKVYRNDTLMASDTYRVLVEPKRLEFEPTFFEGLDAGTDVQVRVEYQVL
jgi:hypothetical protein